MNKLKSYISFLSSHRKSLEKELDELKRVTIGIVAANKFSSQFDKAIYRPTRDIYDFNQLLSELHNFHLIPFKEYLFNKIDIDTKPVEEELWPFATNYTSLSAVIKELLTNDGSKLNRKACDRIHIQVKNILQKRVEFSHIQTQKESIYLNGHIKKLLIEHKKLQRTIKKASETNFSKHTIGKIAKYISEFLCFKLQVALSLDSKSKTKELPQLQMPF